MKQLKTALLIIFSLGLVIFLLRPIAGWYLSRPTIFGTDFYLTGSYLGYMMRHFSLPFSGWKYIWYGGQPLAFDYPHLLFYSLLMPAKIWGALAAIKYGMLISLALFFFFSFWLFYRASGMIILAAGLTALLVWSSGVYGSLLGGGSLPYFACQFFLPLTLILLLEYWKTGAEKTLAATGLIVGLAMLVHPQAPVAYLFPAGLIFIWLRPFSGRLRVEIAVRLKNSFLYLLLAVLVSLPQVIIPFSGIFERLLAVLRPGGAGNLEIGAAVSDFNFEKAQFWRFITKTNQYLWAMLAGAGLTYLALLPLVVKNKTRLGLILPALVLLGYALGFIWAFANRVNPFQGGWYRAFWAIPLLTALLIAANAGVVCQTVGQGIGRGASRIAVLFLLTIFSLLSAQFFGSLKKEEINWSFSLNHLLERQFLPSGAFPDVLDRNYDRWDELKSTLIPRWLPADDQNWRLYDLDAEVNIWWSAIFDMPLAKGYLDLPDDDFSAKRDGALFLRDLVLYQNEAEKNLGWSREMAKNSGLFFLDWGGIKYLEGGYSEQRANTQSPSDFILDPEVLSRKEVVQFSKAPFYIFRQTENGYKLKDDPYEGANFLIETDQQLTFYEIRDEQVSPIMRATNEPLIALIGHPDGQELIYRALAFLNFNSQKAIVVNGPKFIDDWDGNDYRNFSAVIVYFYDYHRRSRAFNLLAEYIKQGGTLFIETGGDAKEAAGENLPEIFPVRRLIRSDLGPVWDFPPEEIGGLAGIDFTNFAKVFSQGTVWNLSWAEPDDLKGEAILKQRDKIIMARMDYGRGKIYWSGINLPYHLVYHKNLEEAKLLGAIISGKFPPAKEKPEWKLKWVSAEEREITYRQANGILFKENYYPGWGANFKRGFFSQPLKIYPAGPHLPGMMYVRLPADENEGTVTFRYRGSLKSWLFTLIPFLTVFLALGCLFCGRIFYGEKIAVLRNKIRLWWDKEDQ